MTTNQTKRIGPNTMPIPDVPLNWMANSAVSSPIVIGMTMWPNAGVATSKSFHGREHADRRRDHSVAEQQSRAQHQRPQQKRRAALVVFMQQAVEREDAALAVVLRAQHEERVFDGDDEGDRPDHQRHAAEHVGGRLRARRPGREITGPSRRAARCRYRHRRCRALRWSILRNFRVARVRHARRGAQGRRKRLYCGLLSGPS